MGYILGYQGTDLLNIQLVTTAVVCMMAIVKASIEQTVTGFPSGFV
jgi:hypothetical protein